MKFALTISFAIILAATSACGGDPYKAPPAGNGYKPGNTQQPAANTKKPGDSLAKEYEVEMKAAFAAHREYEAVKADAEARKEPYIEWAEHLYAALAYANVHERNGHSKDGLPRFKELKELKSGYFKNALGPSDDPRVKAAMKNWEDSTS
jgi:hypothetical protein